MVIDAERAGYQPRPDDVGESPYSAASEESPVDVVDDQSELIEEGDNYVVGLDKILADARKILDRRAILDRRERWVGPQVIEQLEQALRRSEDVKEIEFTIATDNAEEPERVYLDINPDDVDLYRDGVPELLNEILDEASNFFDESIHYEQLVAIRTKEAIVLAVAPQVQPEQADLPSDGEEDEEENFEVSLMQDLMAEAGDRIQRWRESRLQEKERKNQLKKSRKASTNALEPVAIIRLYGEVEDVAMEVEEDNPEPAEEMSLAGQVELLATDAAEGKIPGVEFYEKGAILVGSVAEVFPIEINVGAIYTGPEQKRKTDEIKTHIASYIPDLKEKILAHLAQDGKYVGLPEYQRQILAEDMIKAVYRHVGKQSAQQPDFRVFGLETVHSEKLGKKQSPDTYKNNCRLVWERVVNYTKSDLEKEQKKNFPEVVLRAVATDLGEVMVAMTDSGPEQGSGGFLGFGEVFVGKEAREKREVRILTRAFARAMARISLLKFPITKLGGSTSVEIEEVAALHVSDFAEDATHPILMAQARSFQGLIGVTRDRPGWIAQLNAAQTALRVHEQEGATARAERDKQTIAAMKANLERNVLYPLDHIELLLKLTKPNKAAEDQNGRFFRTQKGFGSSPDKVSPQTELFLEAYDQVTTQVQKIIQEEVARAYADTKLGPNTAWQTSYHEMMRSKAAGQAMAAVLNFPADGVDDYLGAITADIEERTESLGIKVSSELQAEREEPNESELELLANFANGNTNLKITNQDYQTYLSQRRAT